MRLALVAFCLLAGCSTGPIGPTAEEVSQALQFTWQGPQAPPLVTWFGVDGNCSANPNTGTVVVDAQCLATAGVNFKTGTSGANLPWTGSLSSSGWCWAVITIKRGFAAGQIPPLANDAPDVLACQSELEAAGL